LEIQAISEQLIREAKWIFGDLIDDAFVGVANLERLTTLILIPFLSAQD
jgi:hypothetical protein